MQEQLSAVLRATLRPAHEGLEHRLGLPDGVRDRSDYARLLSLWSAVWAAVASWADLQPVRPGLADAAHAARAALADDGCELRPGPGRPAARPVAALPFPVPQDEASHWGVSYVLKGSTLGNRVLTPLIARRCDDTPPTAFRYLTGTGRDVRRDWVRFRDHLDGWADSVAPPQRGRAVHAAGATFALVGAAADAVGWPAAGGAGLPQGQR